MTEIYILKTDMFSQSEYDSIRKLVSEERRKLCDRFRFKEDYNRSLLGEYLILKMVSDKCNIPIGEISIFKDANGKTYVDSKYGLYINVSHSGEYVVGIISDKNCGIDVEKIEDIDISMFDTVFTKQEMQYINSFPKEKQLEKFYEIWTIKESYTKYVGLGLGIDLNSFNVITNGKRAINLQVEDLSCNIETVKFDEAYRLAITYLDDEYIVNTGELPIADHHCAKFHGRSN